MARPTQNHDRLITELSKVERDFNGFNELVFDSPVHSGQEDYFRNADKKFNTLTCGNSWGKTELLARMHAYYLIYKYMLDMPPRQKAYAAYDTGNVSYTYDVSEKVFTRLIQLRTQSPIMRYLVDRVDATKKKIWLKNGSTYVSGSTKDRGKYIEGERFALLTVEEAGYETNLTFLRDSVLKPRTLVPAIPGGGRIHFVGTPKPFSDPEYPLMFRKGLDPLEPDYYSREGSTYENTFLDFAQVQQMEDTYKDDPTLLAQVIYGKFVSEQGAPFEQSDLDRVFIPRLPHPAPPKGGHLYICTWDLARKHTKPVGYALDYTFYPLIIIAREVYFPGKPTWQDIYAGISSLHYIYGSKAVVLDSTGVGDVVLERVRDEMLLPAEGVISNTNKRQAMIEHLIQAVGQSVPVPPGLHHIIGEQTVGAVKAPNLPGLRQELINFRWEKGSALDDRVMALAQGIWWLARRGVNAGFLGGDYNATLAR
ncbi:MAG: hypothetical protein ACYC3G_00625 [Minisyncoccota bacterium]